MVNNISKVAPVLSYVASTDISAFTNGYMRHSIHFSKDIVTYGNVIMFEYAITNNDTVIPTNINTQYGFVSVDSAIQTGISNEYILPIPAEMNVLTNKSNDNIRVRVYSGLTDINDVFVSEWSNSLEVHQPPAQVNLNSALAYYDSEDYRYATSNLYVFMSLNDNPYDYDNMSFLVSIVYQDENNNTVWDVSEPTPANTINSNTMGIEVPLKNSVSKEYPEIYIHSVHALYNWTDPAEKLYYAISNSSLEIVAKPASSDNKPDITKVVYNVYNDDPISVPGTQTITVTYIPPENSLVPIYNVSKYDLYYSIDNGNFIKYNTQPIIPTTLSYTVNVGSNTILGTPLNMSCGQNIKFRVDCTTIMDVVESSDESYSTNIFKYSQEVTNLGISDIRNVAGKTSFTVNFNGVNDLSTPNKGCGAGLLYNIKINDQTYSPSGGDAVTYVSGKTYAVNYSNIPDATGNVSVCLTTQNTNGNTPINGMVVSVPYASHDFTLDPIVYNVYAYGNADQNMILSWIAPNIQNWTATNYNVQLSIDDGTSWKSIAATSNTSYTYDATSHLSDTSVKLLFRVIVKIKKDVTSYDIPSNTQQMKTFTFGSSVSNVYLNWAIAGKDNNFMDVKFSFYNPKNNLSIPVSNNNDGTGINNGIARFNVKLYDNNSNIISQKDISYDSNATPYTVSFDNIKYSKSGNIRIFTYVKNQNDNDSLITYGDYTKLEDYIVTNVPEFKNVVATGSSVSGNIFSGAPLSLYGTVIASSLPESLLTKTTITTNNTTPGFDISYVTDIDGTWIYTFKLYPTLFDTEYPSTFSLNVSNLSGVGSLLYPLV